MKLRLWTSQVALQPLSSKETMIYLHARMQAAGKPWAGKSKDELTAEDKRERAQAWKTEGIQICIDLIAQMQQIEGVAGVHIMAIEWEEAVKPIVEGAGLPPRAEVTPQPVGAGG